MIGRTKKPCPGCGDVCRYRKANEVCHDCKSLIADGKQFRANAARSRTMTIHRIPFAAHALPYFSECREMQSAFYDLIQTVGMPAPKEFPKTIYDYPELILRRPGDTRYGSEHAILFPSAWVEPMRKVWNAAEAISKKQFDNGRERGQSLVLSLARGETSIDDWNEQTTRKKATG